MIGDVVFYNDTEQPSRVWPAIVVEEPPDRAESVLHVFRNGEVGDKTVEARRALAPGVPGTFEIRPNFAPGLAPGRFPFEPLARMPPDLDRPRILGLEDVNPNLPALPDYGPRKGP